MRTKFTDKIPVKTTRKRQIYFHKQKLVTMQKHVIPHKVFWKATNNGQNVQNFAYLSRNFVGLCGTKNTVRGANLIGKNEKLHTIQLFLSASNNHIQTTFCIPHRPTNFSANKDFCRFLAHFYLLFKILFMECCSSIEFFFVKNSFRKFCRGNSYVPAYHRNSFLPCL